MNIASILRRFAATITVGALTGTLLLVVPPTSSARAAGDHSDDRQIFAGKSLYFGEFHSHTGVSDGVEFPTDAFAHVHDEHAADFFAVTEHDVMFDLRNTDDFVDDWTEASSEEWRYLKQSTEEFNASQDEVVAVPGYETTWYDGTGHINVFNTDWRATARAQVDGSVDGFGNRFGVGDLKYDMYTYFARLKLDPEAIGQFNHPSLTSKGNFFNFNGLDSVVDDRIDLIELKSESQYTQYVLALDTGWHVAPTYNGDEHSDTWVTGADAITGVWAQEHTLDGLYAAMNERSAYTTLDENTVLGFAANDAIMGSVLDPATDRLDIEVMLNDPDADDSFTSVKLVSNGGKTVHEFDEVSGNSLQLTHQLEAADGDYLFVRAEQTDGDFAVSAPIWIGETTRGANYAPQIVFNDPTPSAASFGQRISLPAVTAVDDSTGDVTVSYEVFDAAGMLPIDDQQFQVRSYDDHFIVVKAEDSTGNIGAELIRIKIETDPGALDPAGVFQYFGTTAVVAAEPGGAGIAVSTDVTVADVYLQARQVGQAIWSPAQNWGDVDVLSSSDGDVYEVNTIGRTDFPGYGDQITGQPLRSHEFDLSGLAEGAQYEYRLGVRADAKDEAAWTDILGEFFVGGAAAEPVYVVGDLQVTSHSVDELGLLRSTLDTLRAQVPDGGTLVQLGDLVDNGGRGQYWEEVWENVFQGLDVQFAPVAGNHETYGDPDYNSFTPDRSAVFSNMFATPDNGVIGESNYSFDRGDIHFSVLNSNFDLDEQLAWLLEDVRASNAQWHVVMGHFSYYGGSHGSDPGMSSDRAKVTDVLDRLGVDMYLGAHDHVYKRSTIFEGRLAESEAEKAAGVTFVTMGSSGPKFYENTEHWWDDVVFDEDTQIGSVIEETEDGLQFTAYTIDGDVVDQFMLTKPTGAWRVTSTDLADKALPGVGILSYAGARDSVTVTAATFDSTQTRMLDVRTANVTLNHSGVEQFVTFDSPLPVGPSETLKLFIWDALIGGSPASPALTLREGLVGGGVEADPYLIRTAKDLANIDYDPGAYYALANDVDMAGVEMVPIGTVSKFTGVFDGAGHTISGYIAPESTGVGLFSTNHGTIRNLHVHAEIDSASSTAGIVADVNAGIIESTWTSGSLTAASRVGGIAGDSSGVIRDSYSTADVTATESYAGGIVGIQLGESSLTERVYSTGLVQAHERNAAGLVSYARNEPTVQHSVALNSAVLAPSWTHAILGRVVTGQQVNLFDNVTSDASLVSVQRDTDTGATTKMGEIVAAEATRNASLYTSLGWDLGGVWQWDSAAQRPTLLANAEHYEQSVPELPVENGAYVIAKVADLQQLEQHPDLNYVLADDLDLSSIENFAPLTPVVPFSGTLDGAGHIITGLTSNHGGLFALITGSVHDLGVVDASIDATGDKIGALANEGSGTFERVYVTGSVAGKNRVGGILGEGPATIRDSYTTADVHATGLYAGGVVAIATGGATVERVYSTGSVVADARNAGGVISYGYDGTVVRDSVALNSKIAAGSWSHAIVGRVAAGHNAALENNQVASSVPISGEQSTAEVPGPGSSTLRGEIVSDETLRTASNFGDSLGWDLAAVWEWSAEMTRPVLRAVSEDPGVAMPNLPMEDGAYIVGSVDDLRVIDSFPAENYVLSADLDLSSIANFIPLAGDSPFTGSFDGAGHVISGLTSTHGGLFLNVAGIVRDLAVVDVEILAPLTHVGALANTATGTITGVFTSGTLSGENRVGGIIGQLDAAAELTDSYSTASVEASASYAGGIVGITSAGTTLQRVYASGSVVAGHTGAGGISSYAYTGTTIESVVSLNPTVVAGGNGANAVLGKRKGTPVLTDIFASDAVHVAAADSSSAELMGTQVPDADVRTAEFFDTRGWDLDTIWQWTPDLERPTLRLAAETATAAEIPGVDVPIRIETASELQQIDTNPTAWFALVNDLDLSTITDFAPMASTVPFTGRLDGAGHEIRALTSTTGGLFAEIGVGGRVHDLALTDAAVNVADNRIGILANVNNGDIERVSTAGSVVGATTVGGIVGIGEGTLRDSYSTADVTATESYAGGVIGIALAGSTTERVYSTGAVEAASTAGGIAAYGYTNTSILHSVALNPTVLSGGWAHGIVGRVRSGHTATLADNWVGAGTTVEVSPDAAGLAGERANAGEQNYADFFRARGWDLDTVWAWNDTEKLPTLRIAP